MMRGRTHLWGEAKYTGIVRGSNTGTMQKAATTGGEG